MPERPISGLFEPRPREVVLEGLVRRARAWMTSLPEPELNALLEDCVWHERHRLERARGPRVAEERARVDALAHAIFRGDRAEQIEAACDVVHGFGDEIHGRFSAPAHRFASRFFPPALAALLNGRSEGVDRFDIRQRVTVDGPFELLRTLAREATLLLTPTHVSNLDSPLIGLALTMADLPPFQYGAGLNLFTNPALGWWMRRLGAYTVDRTKKAALYKHVLKDYATVQLTTRHHGLFFPGGTRSRSGRIEQHVKKGLLGTGLAAWQENLAAGRPDPDVYVVPVTLSFALALEASTLIDDHLAEEGKQRYIIEDDEFVQPTRIASFFHRVLSLDSAVVVRFGEPLDVLGQPVPTDAAARAEASRHRRGYVCDAQGAVQRDEQRDHVYTERLARAVCEAWPRGATLLPTHVAAHAAWTLLEERLATRDPFRLVRALPSERTFGEAALVARAEALLASAKAGAKAEPPRWHEALPENGFALLDRAMDTFARYHRGRALRRVSGGVFIEDPRLCLYYQNRVADLGLERT
jgi:glycerol-3-phosphate O-acyltransferase